MGEYGQSQSRARGLTRAILDTFPVMKFSRMPVTQRNFREQDAEPKPSDIESGTGSEGVMEMAERPASREASVAEAEQADVHAEIPAGKTTAPLDMYLPRNVTEGEGTSSPGAGPSQPPTTSNLAAPNAQLVATPIARTPTSPEAGADQPNVMPEAIGRETCPICIIDFEEGDDIRVLPCEGKHVFHQACVDQWLLELSSSCPICRHGK